MDLSRLVRELPDCTETNTICIMTNIFTTHIFSGEMMSKQQLVQAIYANDQQQLANIIKRDRRLLEVKTLDTTPLIIALTLGHLEIAMTLIALGANTLVTDINGNTALHLALSSRLPLLHPESFTADKRTWPCEETIIDLVKLLLEKYDTVWLNKINNLGFAAFQIALLNRTYETKQVSQVIESSEPNGPAAFIAVATETYRPGSEHWLPTDRLNEIVIQHFLSRKDLDINCAQTMSVKLTTNFAAHIGSPLHICGLTGDFSTAIQLIERGASIAATNKFGLSFLALACLEQQLDFAIAVIQHLLRKYSLAELLKLLPADLQDQQILTATRYAARAYMLVTDASTGIPEYKSKRAHMAFMTGPLLSRAKILRLIHPTDPLPLTELQARPKPGRPIKDISIEEGSNMKVQYDNFVGFFVGQLDDYVKEGQISALHELIHKYNLRREYLAADEFDTMLSLFADPKHCHKAAYLSTLNTAGSPDSARKPSYKTPAYTPVQLLGALGLVHLLVKVIQRYPHMTVNDFLGEPTVRDGLSYRLTPVGSRQFICPSLVKGLHVAAGPVASSSQDSSSSQGSSMLPGLSSLFKTDLKSQLLKCMKDITPPALANFAAERFRELSGGWRFYVVQGKDVLLFEFDNSAHQSRFDELAKHILNIINEYLGAAFSKSYVTKIEATKNQVIRLNLKDTAAFITSVNMAGQPIIDAIKHDISNKVESFNVASSVVAAEQHSAPNVMK